MRCANCTEEAIIDKPPRCKKHFLEEFTLRVERTIKEHDLIPPDAKICVAASGGKDSLTTLHILKRLGYTVSALVIDEGIDGYRAHTIEDLDRFCKQYEIELRSVSFEEAFGKKLDTMLNPEGVAKGVLHSGSQQRVDRPSDQLLAESHSETHAAAKGVLHSGNDKRTLHPCTVCGTFRRYLLNKHAHGFDLVATGHNADDEAQSILMNLFRANTFFSRPGPKTGRPGSGLVQRVKPLYFCTEKEIMTYALLNGLGAGFNECPYVPQSYRDLIRNVLNAQAAKQPRVRQQILTRFLEIKARLPSEGSEPRACVSCGEPSQDKTCAACRLQAALGP